MTGMQVLLLRGCGGVERRQQTQDAVHILVLYQQRRTSERRRTEEPLNPTSEAAVARAPDKGDWQTGQDRTGQDRTRQGDEG